MSQLLDLTEARLLAVLLSGRGSTGLGAGALARYYPADRLRRSPYAAPLIDPAYPAGSFDRAIEIQWTTLGQDPDPQNPLDGSELIRLGCTLNIGFAYGKETPQFISTTGSEVAETAATFVRRRAISEMHRVLRALTFPAIFDGTLTSGMSLIECMREPKTQVTLTDLGSGRLLASVQLTLLLEVPTATSYDP